MFCRLIEREKQPNGVRMRSLSLFPLRLYWECLMSRMLRVALGLQPSCSELGSSVTESFFFPLISADGSLLDTITGDVKDEVRSVSTVK